MNPALPDEFTVTKPLTGLPSSVVNDDNFVFLLSNARALPLTPNNQAKKPWLKSVLRSATKNLETIRRWEQHDKIGCRWGVRIDDDSDWMILDVEGPEKGKGDGNATLAELQEKHGEQLPPCPTARSVHGGLHMYGRCPKRFLPFLKNWSSPLFPNCGLDVRTRKGMVAVAPSSGYQWLIRPTQVAMPVWPEWLVLEILQARGIDPDRPATSPKARHTYTSAGPETAASQVSAEPIPGKDRYRLFHCCKTSKWAFYELYTKQVALTDATNSSYEFAITCAALRWGFTPGQCLTLIREWWRDTPWPDPINHPYDEQRFRRVILPDAIRASERFILAYRARKAAEKFKRNAKKIWFRVQAVLSGLGSVGAKVLLSLVNEQKGPKPITKAALMMQLWRHRAEVCHKNGLYRLAAKVVSGGQTPNQAEDVHITSKCYPIPDQAIDTVKARAGRPRKMSEDVEWYSRLLGVRFTTDQLKEIWSQLKQKSKSAAPRNCFLRRVVAEIEDSSGLRKAEGLRSMLNHYYRKINYSFCPVQIGILRAVAELRAITRALGRTPELSELRTFLGNLARSTRSYLAVDEIIARFVGATSKCENIIAA